MELNHLDLIKHSYKIVTYERTKKYYKNISSICHKISNSPSHIRCNECEFFLKYDISIFIEEYPQDFILCKKKRDPEFFNNGINYIVSFYTNTNLYTFDASAEYNPEHFIC